MFFKSSKIIVISFASDAYCQFNLSFYNFPKIVRTEGKIIQWMILENHEMKDQIFEFLAHSFLGSG